MAIVFSDEDVPIYRLITAFDAEGKIARVNTTEEEMEFDYQAYMKDYVPDPDKIHWGLEARQKRREAAIHNNRGIAYTEKGEL